MNVFWINNDVNERLKDRDCWKLKSSFYSPAARSSGLACKQAFHPQLWWRAWPELLLQVGTSMVTIITSGHIFSLLGPDGERWVSSFIYSVLSTAHMSVACEGWGRTALCTSFLSSPRAVGAAPHPLHPHDFLTLSKSPLKTCAFCCGELGSVTPPLQESLMTIIWLPEPLAALRGGSMDIRACNAEHFITTITLVTNWNY